jgi:hypothetical protein
MTSEFLPQCFISRLGKFCASFLSNLCQFENLSGFGHQVFETTKSATLKGFMSESGGENLEIWPAYSPNPKSIHYKKSHSSLLAKLTKLAFHPT